MAVQIDPSRDALFDELGLMRLRESYMRADEKSPQERFKFVAETFGSNPEHAERIYEYASRHWLSFATPILAFGRTGRGLPSRATSPTWTTAPKGSSRRSPKSTASPCSEAASAFMSASVPPTKSPWASCRTSRSMTRRASPTARVRPAAAPTPPSFRSIIRTSFRSSRCESPRATRTSRRSTFITASTSPTPSCRRSRPRCATPTRTTPGSSVTRRRARSWRPSPRATSGSAFSKCACIRASPISSSPTRPTARCPRGSRRRAFRSTAPTSAPKSSCRPRRSAPPSAASPPSISSTTTTGATTGSSSTTRWNFSTTCCSTSSTTPPTASAARATAPCASAAWAWAPWLSRLSAKARHRL